MYRQRFEAMSVPETVTRVITDKSIGQLIKFHLNNIFQRLLKRLYRMKIIDLLKISV